MISQKYITTFWLLILFALAACKKNPTATSEANVAPPARADHAMAYDTKREVVVLFGGRTHDGVLLDDTWEYKNGRWQQIDLPHSPSARNSHSMVYDPNRQTVILFAGQTEQAEYTNDMWEYDGVSWRRLQTSTSPPPRHVAAMVYDSNRGQIVLFGGYGRYQQMWDTWEFDGEDWHELLIDPPITGYGATFPQMAYDSRLNGVVLQCFLSDTFMFDGQTWRNVSNLRNEKGMPIIYTRLAYDTQNEVTVMFGGEKSQSPNQILKSFNNLLNTMNLPQISINREPEEYDKDVWEFDGYEWKHKRFKQGPPARINHAMVFDENRQVVVMFGGYSTHYKGLLNDTWEYNGTEWTQK